MWNDVYKELVINLENAYVLMINLKKKQNVKLNTEYGLWLKLKNAV